MTTNDHQQSKHHGVVCQATNKIELQAEALMKGHIMLFFYGYSIKKCIIIHCRSDDNMFPVNLGQSTWYISVSNLRQGAAAGSQLEPH